MTTIKETLESMDLLLVKGLKSGDPRVSQTCVLRLFYKDCRSLINSIRFNLFKGTVEYDDIVNELYLRLSANNWRALDSYKGEAKLLTWLSCVAWRHFFKIYVRKERESVVDEVPNKRNTVDDTALNKEIRMDIETVLNAMPNRRYAKVISMNIVSGMAAEDVAKALGTTITNLYNLKSRAIRQFLTIYKDVKGS